MQAGTPSSSPSLASTSVPEHCAPSSCRDGSSCNCAISAVIRDDLAGLPAAAHDDRVCGAGFVKRDVGFDDHAVHRADSRAGAGDRYTPVRLPNSVEDAERDQRVEFVEALEGEDGDVHASIVWIANPIRSNNCHAYNRCVVHARYKDVVDALAADIRAGKIPPGTRLLTHRELAAREGLALVTATRVYAELAAMGLVSGEAGRGTFVRETSLSPRDDIDQRAFADDVVDLNFNYPSVPEQADLLRNALRGLASSGDLEALLRYQSHGGRPHERASVALHLEQRGLERPRGPGADRQRRAARIGHCGAGDAEAR